MSKKSLKPISLAVGTAFAVSLSAGNVSSETDMNTSPFAVNELSGGYMQLAAGGEYGGDKSGEEGKCGEGKCGEKKGDKEGTCGEKKGDKEGEGKCGEGKCGEKKGDDEGKSGGGSY
jgi:uncharacterized low-complexity protein